MSIYVLAYCMSSGVALPVPGKEKNEDLRRDGELYTESKNVDTNSGCRVARPGQGVLV